MLGALALLAAMMLGGGVAAAHAEEAPDSSPSATAPADELLAPATVTISSPADGQFLPNNDVTVSGTKSAGSSVVVTASTGAAPETTVCSALVTDPASINWGCDAVLPDGAGVMLTATETLADTTTTNQHSVTISVLGPPLIDQAPAQTAPGVASGTGFNGAIIRLLINGATSQDCHAPVSEGRWRCTIANGAGTYTVTAQQIAPMGTSNSSAPVTLQVNPAPPVEPPPAIPPPVQPAPVLPAPAPPAPPQEQPEPSPAPTHNARADASSLPWLDRPIFPGPSGEGPTIREALTNWGTPTGFGVSLPSPRDTLTGGNWAWGPLLALAFIGLIALPLRLLATSLRGRFTFRTPRLTGRNRGSAAAIPDAAPPRNPWLIGAVPLGATAGLIVLAEGMNGEVRYLRLLFAVGVGLAILNVVGVAVSTRFASTRLGVSGRLRFLPLLLLAAAVATVLSRVTGIEPPIVGGVLIGTGFALAVSARPRAVVNLAQVGAVLVLAVVAWFGHSAMGAVDGFWASVALEALATICLAGLGSALILMLPLGALPGRVVLEWSPPAWVASTLVVGTVVSAILLGRTQPALPLLVSALIVAGFAAVCVAVWTWANYAQVSRA